MTKIILTIGGSDPFSGGGIQTDLKTFENHQLFGLSVLTCVVTSEVSFEIHRIEPELLTKQLHTLANVELAAIKIGLIHQIENIAIIKDFLLQHPNVPVVLDPVFAFKETTTTYEKDYVDVLRNELFPIVTVITPNLSEAEILVQRAITTIEELQQAARELSTETAVCLKGGAHLAGEHAVEVLAVNGKAQVFQEMKLALETVNGAGCSFASSIAANLALGESLPTSVAAAKAFVYESIQQGVLVKENFGSVWHQGEKVRRSHG
ncbi:hydroxymethylpyrimidine/phosphomethylpyrimidine kinase [Candidatus Enterococcus willemsii]|uniref:pyridoxal kinase n=1 Tax=Candidatus Enterococcus willemsii TaxID=1857215 RepID=A0ABQ6Z035_9ENTE|nr:hydroxymethylpyrimidine/phosphomethylpyrimidine kinase [Enterococcus sp. CU12B]KAF1303747.1 hypothetical protein BAU17_11210 [Enterococcus sp. CU12B]